MNFKYWSPIIATSVIAIGSAPAWGESELASDLSFSCQINQGIPVTIAEAEGNQQAIFHWDSKKLPDSVDPETTCNEVAIKLGEHTEMGYDMTDLRFIGSQQGDLPAICATHNTMRECSLVLLTLAPTDKPPETASLLLSSIIDKDLEVSKVELNNRGFQSTAYPVPLLQLLLGRKLVK
ncbi:MAG TPA: COP23 domain-containing protein [Xenococcaceae cyanobacterium]